MWHIFHRWEDILRKEENTFLDEPITEYWCTNYSVCKVCGMVREADCGMSGTYYEQINGQKKDILMSKVSRDDVGRLLLDLPNPNPPEFP